MDEHEINNILREVIFSLNREPNSYSRRLAFLRNRKPNILDILQKNEAALEMAAAEDECLLYNSIGLADGHERVRLSGLLTKMNIDMFKRTSPDVLIKKLNNYFIQNKIRLSASPVNISSLRTAIEKIHSLQQAMNLIHVMKYWEEFLAIFFYCEHFNGLPDEKIKSEIADLMQAYINLKVEIIDEAMAQKTAAEVLSKVGHLKGDLETKPAGILMTIVERMIIAGNAVQTCRKTKKGSTITKDNLLDEIASYWLKEEEIELQNTSEYIIPPPGPLTD